MNNILALVTARGGSKGLPRKNVLPLAGKPLIAWTIEAALGSRFISECVVSTDDAEIAGVARKAGALVPFMRPENLASDTASSIEVILHALEWAQSQSRRYDTLLLLQPTSPLRTKDDIDAALELFSAAGAKSCVSVCECVPPPHWSFTMDADNRLRQLIECPSTVTRRQDLPATFHVNGALYIENVDWLLAGKTLISNATLGYVMPRERSVDIDSALDFLIAETLLLHRHAV